MPVNYADIVLSGMQRRSQASIERGRALVRRSANQDEAIARFGQSLAEYPSKLKQKREEDEIRELDNAFTQSMIHTQDPAAARDVIAKTAQGFRTQRASSEAAKRMIGLDTVLMNRETAKRLGENAKADLEYKRAQAAKQQAEADASLNEGKAFASAAAPIADMGAWPGVPYAVPERAPSPDEMAQTYMRSGHATSQGVNALNRPVVAQTGADSRIAVAGLNADNRRDIATLAEGGRMDRWGTPSANVVTQQGGAMDREKMKESGRNTRAGAAVASREKIARLRADTSARSQDIAEAGQILRAKVASGEMKAADARAVLSQRGARLRGLEAKINDAQIREGLAPDDEELAFALKEYGEAEKAYEEQERALDRMEIEQIAKPAAAPIQTSTGKLVKRDGKWVRE